MATTTNYSWTTPDDTDLVKDGASAIRTLGTAIDTTVFTNAGNAINKTIVDAKGDLIVATADNTIDKLAVGANDTVLTADSSTATGLKWATPAAGGMTLISETVANANSSISLTSIPGTYKQLLLVWHGIVHSTTGSSFTVRLNNDSGNNYKHGVAWNYNTSASGRMESTTELSLLRSGDSQGIFGKAANVNGLEYDAKGQLLLDNYASTTKKKFFNFNASFYNQTDAVSHFGSANGTYDSASAITSIDIVRLSGTATITNSTNTSIRLYGIS